MADEITYDRVEDAEQKILEAISGVGDTVNGLPASLETDFTEVKNAISDVKTDVGNVNTSVGNVNDAVSDVKSDVSAVNTAVSNVKKDTNNIKNSLNNSTLFNADSVVKSVQRGTYTYQPDGSNWDKTVGISSVNINKAILILSWATKSVSGDSTLCGIKGVLSSTSITFSGLASQSMGSRGNIAWQVIEFY